MEMLAKLLDQGGLAGAAAAAAAALAGGGERSHSGDLFKAIIEGRSDDVRSILKARPEKVLRNIIISI